MLYGVAIGLLRQQLDTLIRLCYIAQLCDQQDEASRLIKQSANGEQWTLKLAGAKHCRVTDKEMLDLAHHLGGWEKLIYKVGCRLIHLSDFHLYLEKDPCEHFQDDEKLSIIQYMMEYHHYSHQDVTFEKISEFLPAIMGKISSNIEFHIEEIPRISSE